MEPEPQYAPLVDVLVAFYAAIQKQHDEDAKDPEVRKRLHEALDAILDGRARFRTDVETTSSTPPPEPSASPTPKP
jgi:hypothetical protein